MVARASILLCVLALMAASSMASAIQQSANEVGDLIFEESKDLCVLRASLNPWGAA